MKSVVAGGRALLAGLGVFGLLALGAGCAHGGSSSAGAAPSPDRNDGERVVGPYYPLAVGNQWTYQVELLGERHQQTVQILAQHDGFYEDSSQAHLKLDRDGLRDEKRYLLQAPLQAGHTWVSQVGMDSREHYTITSVDAPCNVAAGKFPACVEVESRLQDPKGALVNDSTFARDVGLVRVRIFREAKGKRVQQASLELTSFQVVTPGNGPPLPR